MVNSQGKQTITAHVLVKNEDKYLWFAIMSVIDYMDKMIIFDTGSEDNTIRIVKGIMASNPEYNEKIHFEEKGNADKKRIGKLRQEMIDITDTDYFFLLDGDEIWWGDSIRELVRIVQENKPLLVAQHFINCAKDIKHYREPWRDAYPQLDKKAAASLRLYSMHIPGIHCEGDYGIEGFWDTNKQEVHAGQYKIIWQNGSYFHASKLRRSSKEMANNKVYFRFLKSFYAYDRCFAADFKYPEVFYMHHPTYIESPFYESMFSLRNLIYFLLDDLKLRALLNLLKQALIKMKMLRTNG